MANKLKLLDLFSGIGGISYGLRSLCETVAYCDADPHCRTVLERNMRLGRLDTAPVLHDIRTLHAGDLPPGVRVVAGGFPCQDISASGHKNSKGIHGERSGLFTEIVRLVREIDTVDYIFLENVPNIYNKGLQTVLSAIHRLGFDCAHGLFQANEVRCPQRRSRWFLLAVRRGKGLPPVTHARASERAWKPEPARLVLRSSNPSPRRYKMLGNSVVPQCVQHAWDVLVHSMATHGAATQQNCAPQCSLGYINICKRGRQPYAVSRNVRLTYLSTDVVLPNGVRKNLWGTLTRCYSMTYATYPTAHRGFQNVPNRVMYDTATVLKYRRSEDTLADYTAKWTMSPQFAEWLMGYPTHWTLLT